MAAYNFKETTVYKKAFAHKYIDEQTKNSLLNTNEEVGKLINHIIINPEKY